MDKRQNSFDALLEETEKSEALVEKAQNMENLSPEEQAKVMDEINQYNETNPFANTVYDPSFVDPVGNAVTGFLPFAIGAIVIAVIVAIMIMLRSKRIKQAAVRKKSTASKRFNDALLAEALKADKTAEKESLEDELAKAKAEYELKMKQVRQH